MVRIFRGVESIGSFPCCSRGDRRCSAVSIQFDQEVQPSAQKRRADNVGLHRLVKLVEMFLVVLDLLLELLELDELLLSEVHLFAGLFAASESITEKGWLKEGIHEV